MTRSIPLESLNGRAILSCSEGVKLRFADIDLKLARVKIDRVVLGLIVLIMISFPRLMLLAPISPRCTAVEDRQTLKFGAFCEPVIRGKLNLKPTTSMYRCTEF